MPRREKIYLVLVGFFLVALLMANVLAASKLIRLGAIGDLQLIVAVGILAYPITFLVTDLISELYGPERANFAVWVGFIVSLVMLGMIEVAKAVPSLDPAQQTVVLDFFKTNIRAVFGSMIAYLVAQFLDVRLFHFWKRLTEGRHLWLRNNGSTIGSQLVDTVLVTTILFYGTVQAFNDDQPMELSDIAPIILSGFIFKGVVALIDTPLLYLGVRLLRPFVDGPGRAEQPQA